MQRNIWLLIMGLMACTSTPEKDLSKIKADFDQMLASYHEERLSLYPLEATFAGDARYNDKFPNNLSEDFLAEEALFYNTYLASLDSFADHDLENSQVESKEILRWECEINLERLEFPERNYMPIDQMWSVNLMMGQLAGGTSAQPFQTVEDYHHWLSRLRGFTIWMTSALDKMKGGMEANYVLPKSLISKVIPQFGALVDDQDLQNHLYYSPIKLIPASFSDDEKHALDQKYTAFLTDTLIPTFGALNTFFSGPYMEAGRESSGYNDLRNGDAYYAHQIKKYTTTNMSADEIHQLGLNEVSRLLSEMEDVKSEVGFEGDIKTFFDHVRTNPDLMPFDDPQQVIDHFNEIHERIKPQVNALFDLQPKTAFEVRRTEAFREASASAEYNQGSLDGTRPGIFYVPIPDVENYNIVSDEDLFLHEAIPGHHFQISLQQENQDLPDFRKILWYSAYGEGWALYTESLGKELGLYTDPYQYFGMLSAEMHRAIRLVVDTGIHSKGWSREKAIQYSLENEAESEAGIISEIERYMANPGQALSYKIGQLKILELRARAEQELGDKFDIKEFHNRVLESGCVPLSFLENKIDAWIKNS